ncbi:MAG TPA: ribonuclease R, partial [Pusillimonas sp.]|nr:ribonuclease R [Pusillimonas sp.]
MPLLPADFDPEVPSRESILAQLRQVGKPIDVEDLARSLGTQVPLSTGFDRRLRAMERDGQLLYNANGKLLVNKKMDFIAGRVQGHRDGFGFLVREDGGPDVFLLPREMLKVLHGDRVLAKVDGDYRGRPQATIVEVVER